VNPSDLDQRAESRVGTTLRGKYRIDSILGIGGMAVVYAATHRNQKRFAVKMLHRELSLEADIRARFLREGYAANTVNHPGAVAVLDDDVAEDGAAFLVMELLEGDSIDDLWTRAGRRLPLWAALGVAHQTLDVLEAAHKCAIVHRDIKPANLFLVRDGRLKVLDFGIARLRDATTSHLATRTGAMLGTPAFMAPEQALGEVNEVGPQTDVWALGATLFTLISGELVHEANNPSQLLVKAATTPARSLSAVAPEAPDPVVRLVAQALAFDRAARWPDAASMREAVESVHQELFGEPPRHEQLASLFEGGNPAASRPPARASRAPATLTAAETGVRVSAPRPTPAPPVATTTSAKPVSASRSVSGPHGGPPWGWIVAAGIAIASAGTAAVHFAGGPKPESAPSATTERPAQGAVVAPPREEVTVAPHVSAIDASALATPAVSLAPSSLGPAAKLGPAYVRATASARPPPPPPPAATASVTTDRNPLRMPLQ
jgi:eukaryotic-like serine/threonine-protein kinase